MVDLPLVKKKLDAAIKQLQAVSELISHGEPEFPSAAQKKLDGSICLLCHQPLDNVSTRPSRGNHELCYKKVKRWIDNGEITESEAIERGILAPPGPSGRRAKSTSIDALINDARKDPPSKKK